ncbi:MAG: aldo/keto reductase [Proteobacteria bacterium]|nr:aldo/keto reductase [Pseudomonadota bacterium]
MLPKVTLPGTSLTVSRLCLGTNMFGTALDQAQSHTMLDRFVALGGNFIDTARMYGDWVPGVPVGAREVLHNREPGGTRLPALPGRSHRSDHRRQPAGAAR